jgi:hypothetical protein
MTLDQIKPVGAKVLLQRCERSNVKDEDGKVLIYTPALNGMTNVASWRYWFQIVAVGNKCRHYHAKYVGWFVRGPERIGQEGSILVDGVSIINEWYLLDTVGGFVYSPDKE